MKLYHAVLYATVIHCVLARTNNIEETEVEVDNDDDGDAVVNMVKMAPQPTEHPITKAIEVIELVSKLSSDTTNAINFIRSKIPKPNTGLTDPLTFATTIMVYGLIKVISFMVSAFFYVSSMVAPWWQQNTTSSIPLIDLYTLQNIDYNIISNSINSVPEKSFKLLDIREDECKSRAMCEVGELVRKYFPQIGVYVRLATERLDLRDIYTTAMLRGVGWTDCDSTYGRCSKSPFKKFHRILNAISKMY